MKPSQGLLYLKDISLKSLVNIIYLHLCQTWFSLSVSKFDFVSLFIFFFSFSQVLSALDILQPPHIDYFEEMYPNQGM